MQKDLLTALIALAILTNKRVQVNYTNLQGLRRTRIGWLSLHTITGEVLIYDRVDGYRCIKLDLITAVNPA